MEYRQNPAIALEGCRRLCSTGFYAAHDVGELLIVDPQERRVHWLALQSGGEYRPVERSGRIALGPAELAERIDWPE